MFRKRERELTDEELERELNLASVMLGLWLGSFLISLRDMRKRERTRLAEKAYAAGWVDAAFTPSVTVSDAQED